jgi:LacI family transcriptional regulator, gluconate utilization system Gnt-I transcriptional repressor
MKKRPSILTNPSGAVPEVESSAVPARQRRGHGRVTLAEVAKRAGVTAITVSRFLREPQRVAGETADRVRAALRDSGYVPNKQAGQLASGQSRMVAALIPSITNSIFAETVQGLGDGLQAAGYELMLASTGYSMEREEEQLRAVLGWFPSGVVVTGSHHTEGALALLNAAQRNGTPVIEVWDHHPGRPAGSFAQVGFNHEQVGRDMARHLLSLGRRPLIYVDSGVVEDFRAHERGDGFLAEALAAGVPAHRVVAPATEAIAAGRQALAALLHSGVRGEIGSGGKVGKNSAPAVAFANDHLACGALLEAQVRQVKVPQALALMGFGDFPIGAELLPPLTTVRPPRYEIGAEAARLLCTAWGESGIDAPAALRWELLVRGSTFAPSTQ